METLESRLQRRMHVSLYALLFLISLLAISVLLESCTDKCEVKRTYTYYEPVYTTFAELQANTGVVSPQPITQVGKIYLKDHWIFVNEPGKGIHIIDNTDPSSPKKISFLKIPGNYGMAVNNNILYADSYIDLIAFDISNINQIKEVSRIANAFEYFNYEIGFQVDRTKGLITTWEEKQNVNISDSNCDFVVPQTGIVCYDGGIVANSSAEFKSSLAITPGNGSGPGVGGSLATFTIANNHLYTLGAGNMKSFDISNEAIPVAGTSKFVTWDAETIFPYRNMIFIGSSSGMYIFDVTNADSPELISTYAHVRSCDPVVVQDDYAYLTLHSGTVCGGFFNQLEIINISTPSAPQLVKVYPMTNPHGLGIDGETLFVCDGSDGLKVFNASDVMAIDSNKLATYKNLNAQDVIPFNDILIVIAETGLYEYNYSDPAAIKPLGHIAFN